MAQPRNERKQGRSVLEKRRVKHAKRAERAAAQRATRLREQQTAS